MNNRIRTGDEVVCVSGYENVGLEPKTGWKGYVEGIGQNGHPFIKWYSSGMSGHCHVNRLKAIPKETVRDNGMAFGGMCFIPSSSDVKNAVLSLASVMGINIDHVDQEKPVVVYRDYGITTSDNIIDDKVDVGELDFVRRLMNKVELNRAVVQDPDIDTVKELAIRAYNFISKLNISKCSDIEYRSKLMQDMARYGLAQIDIYDFLIGANRGHRRGEYTPVSNDANGTVEGGQ
jgi:hypothetical protein